MSNIEIPEAILGKALEAHAKGKKAFDSFLGVVEMAMGCSPKVFRDSFEAVRVKAQSDADISKVRTLAEQYKIPAGLQKVVKAGQAYIAKYTVEEKKEGDKVVTEGFTPRLTYVVTVEGDEMKLEILSGKVGKRSANGTVSSNSRISAFVAWQRGFKAGDTFKVVKLTEAGKVTGYKVDGRVVASRGKGGLVQYILKMHKDSNTARILRDYGNSLD